MKIKKERETEGEERQMQTDRKHNEGERAKKEAISRHEQGVMISHTL